jgi:hypothetical protein
MGFDSEERFTEMDKDCDMTNGIRVEMMELKPVVVKKTTKKGTRGEGRTPFGKMVKYDDFIYIFHGKRFAKGGAPVDKILVLEHLLCVHSPDGSCASFFFPSFSDFLGAISRSARHELFGGYGERGGEIWVDWGSLRGRRRDAALFGGFWKFLADCRLKA